MMDGAIRWLANVISGRYRHWNDTHNQAFNELWSKWEELEEPARTIIREILVSSLTISSHLASPDEADPILEIDPLELDISFYRKIHRLHLAVLCGLFTGLNPQFQSTLREALHHMEALDATSQTWFEEARVDSSEGPKELAWSLWEEIQELCYGSDPGPDPTGRYQYSTIFLTAGGGAFKNIRTALKQ